jgi:ABC-type antimicrobial peptide transport system permease subunit
MIGAGEKYCTTLGIRILRGRDLEIADRGRAPIPVVVNRTLSDAFFGNASPLGRQLLMGKDKEELLEVVGVAGDARMRTLGEGNMPALFKPDFNSQLLVSVAGNPVQWIHPLRRALAEVDDTAALDVRPLYDAVAGAIFPMRVASGFLGALSGLGLVLALVGLYGSVSYAAGRSERDFGIRAALGASRRRILWTALQGGLVVLACGVLFGIPLAVSAMRPLVDLLPEGVNPWGLGPFFSAMFLLLGTGFLAAWLPARHAASVDPAKLLRQQ